MSVPGEAASVTLETPTPERSWLDQAIEVPSVPLMDQLKDNLTPAGIAMAYTVGQLCLSMVDDCKSSLQIPHGARLPIPSEEDKYGGLLKVIREYRTLQSGFSLFANWGRGGNQEEFDAQTRRMEADTMYAGRPARLNVQFDDDEQITSLFRTVGYYLAAPSKKQLAGIPSNLINSSNFMPVYATTLLPPVKVGTPYKYGSRGTSTVVSAEIVRPANSNRQSKSKAQRRSIRLPSFNILPKPVMDSY